MTEAGMTVSELNRLVGDALHREPRLQSVTVRGEVSGFKHHLSSGHWYFTLKDAQTSVSSVMFRSNTLRAAMRPKDGDSVVVTGYVDIYPQQGKYQLYCTGLRAAGTGDLFQQFEALKQKLNAEGLFDQRRKRPLPLLPRKVAVVTSESGAALHDILNVSGMRCPSVPIVVIPTAVQGTGAGAEIAAHIRQAGRIPGVDVILVGRGGGSAEDLWCFNEEAVVRAVAASPVPVVSGVGHEVDTTLCDYAADVRGSTPSNAAEIVFPDRKELRSRIGLIRMGLTRAAGEALYLAEKRIAAERKRMELLSPARRLTDLKTGSRLARETLNHSLQIHLAQSAESLREARNRLGFAVTRRTETEGNRLVRLRERLRGANPLEILKRGFAVVYDEQRKVLATAAEAGSRTEMTVRFSDGSIRVTRKD